MARGTVVFGRSIYSADGCLVVRDLGEDTAFYEVVREPVVGQDYNCPHVEERGGVRVLPYAVRVGVRAADKGVAGIGVVCELCVVEAVLDEKIASGFGGGVPTREELEEYDRGRSTNNSTT